MQKIDVTYAFYLSEFCCGGEATLPSGEFDKFVKRAKLRISGLGVNFISEFEEEIKLCICEVAEVIYAAAKSANVKAESIDGYSVTFEDSNNINKKVKNIVVTRLANTGILYAGVE